MPLALAARRRLDRILRGPGDKGVEAENVRYPRCLAAPRFLGSSPRFRTRAGPPKGTPRRSVSHSSAVTGLERTAPGLSLRDKSTQNDTCVSADPASHHAPRAYRNLLR